MPNHRVECKVSSVKCRTKKAFVIRRLALISFFLLLFTIHYPLSTSTVLAAPPAPQPCSNPVATDNLTDNYITQENGNPPGTSETDITSNPDAFKFKVTRTGRVGEQPAQIKKELRFTVNFSRLQALFGENSSNYAEGSYQNQTHASVNLLGLTNGQFQKYQGAIARTAPKVMTDALRENYVKYVYGKPELAESATIYTDINGQNPRTIYDMVQAFGGTLPQAPKAGEDKTNWNLTWGKYWEKIPTSYDEFYLGKLEFRAYMGSTLIEKLKAGEPGYCNRYTALRTVEFPVPRFFRTAQTTGVLNQMMLPEIAQSEDRSLIDITGTAARGAVAGAKNSVSEVVKSCFDIAVNNPVSKVLKKVVKITLNTKGAKNAKTLAQNTISPLAKSLKSVSIKSLEKIDLAKPVYAGNQATNPSITQNGCGTAGKVNATLEWDRADDPSGGIPLQDQRIKVSLADNFAGSVTQTVDLTKTQTSKTLNDFFLADTDYWWRVDTQYWGTWIEGENVHSFHSITCPSCTISPSTVTVGGTVTVTSDNDLSGTIGMQGAFGTPVYADLGTLPANGTDDITVPTDAQLGLYVVRVGTGNVGCTPNLQVDAAPVAACVFSPTTLRAGENLGIIINNFATGDRAVKIAGRTFGNVEDVGTIPDTGGGVTIPTTAVAPQEYDVLVNNGTLDVTCTGILQVNAAPTAACVFDPPTLVAGNNLGIINNNFATGDRAVKIAGRTFGNVIDVGSIPQTGGSVTIPTTTVAPQEYDVLVNNGTLDVTCTGILQVNPAPACTITPHAVSAGETVTVKSIGGLFGSIGIQEISGLPIYSSLNTLVANGTAEIVIPLTAPDGTYTVRAGDYYAVTCTPNLTVTALVPACTVTPSIQNVGGQITIASQNGLFGQARMVRGTDPPILIGNLAPDGSIDWTIPPATPTGDYMVRVAVPPYVTDCGTLKINPVPTDDPTDEPTPLPNSPNGSSCIKDYGQGKAGNAPYCAIYGNKFDPPPGTSPLLAINIIPGECGDGDAEYKLNSEPNVLCTFIFSFDSNILAIDGNPDNDLTIPPTGSNGKWDSCTTSPLGADYRTCTLTVAVWPDFRVPFLSQAWNNALYSDSKEVLPTMQQTGRPGVYSFAQPKVVSEFVKQDPAATKLQALVDACKADLPTDPLDLPTSGCKDLFNWAGTSPSGWPPEFAGLPLPSEYPTLEKCITDNLLSPQLVAPCLVDVAEDIIDSMVKLPAQANQNVAGINTGGRVLADNADQKIRYMGGVECGKHLTRDIMLKPKVLQRFLGVDFECDLTASSTPPGGTPPPTGTPLPTTPPGGGCSSVVYNGEAYDIQNYIECYAAGKTEPISTFDLATVMLGTISNESGGGDTCSVGGAGEIGVFQFMANTWGGESAAQAVRAGGYSDDEGSVARDSGSSAFGVPHSGGHSHARGVCWENPGADNTTYATHPAMGPNIDDGAWDPYLQVRMTHDIMLRTEGNAACNWTGYGFWMFETTGTDPCGFFP